MTLGLQKVSREVRGILKSMWLKSRSKVFGQNLTNLKPSLTNTHPFPGRRRKSCLRRRSVRLPRGLRLRPARDRRGRHRSAARGQQRAAWQQRRRAAVPGLSAERRAVRVRRLRQPVVLQPRLSGEAQSLSDTAVETNSSNTGNAARGLAMLLEMRGRRLKFCNVAR